MECGAPVVFDEFSHTASCPACGTAHRLPRDSSGAWLLTYACELKTSDARQRALEIVGPKLGKSKRNRLEVLEVFPLYLPVWKFRCHAAGWFKTHEGEILPLNLTKEMSIPAYENSASIGVPRTINGSDARISPENEFPMLHVKLGSSLLKNEAEKQMTADISSITGTTAPMKNIRVILQEPILALNPAWIVRFRTRNGEHSLTIDGVTGQSMNVVDIPVTDEKRMSETILAVVCGSLLSAGVALSIIDGIRGPALGLSAAGTAVFVIANLLRVALRSSKLAPRPKGRRASA